MDCHPVSSPLIGTTINKSGSIPTDDDSELGDHIEIFDSDDSQEPDPLWSLFAGIVKQYPEFDLINQDRKWFKERVKDNSDYKFLDMTYEIKNWGDWLDIEHRKKTRNEKNRFPISNLGAC